MPQARILTRSVDNVLKTEVSAWKKTIDVLLAVLRSNEPAHVKAAILVFAFGGVFLLLLLGLAGIEAIPASIWGKAVDWPFYRYMFCGGFAVTGPSLVWLMLQSGHIEEAQRLQQTFDTIPAKKVPRIRSYAISRAVNN